MDSPNKLIIDGNNLLYCAYFVNGSPKMDNYVNGINTATLYRFLTKVKSIVNNYKPNEIVITWDKRLTQNGTNFRKELVAYKEQRTNEEAHKAIHEYTDHLEPFMAAMGIKTIYPNLMEADDVIGFLTKVDTNTNLIYSSDKDLLQLVNEKTSIYLHTHKLLVTLDNFEEFTTVKPEHYVVFKATMGDTSDNISGLDKYGPVRAKKLAERLNMSPQAILDYKGSEDTEKELGINQFQLAKLQRNIQIMWLDYNHPQLVEEALSYAEQWNDYKIYFDSLKFREICNKYKFFSFIREVGSWRELFDKNNYSNCDLLSTISI